MSRERGPLVLLVAVTALAVAALAVLWALPEPGSDEPEPVTPRSTFARDLDAAIGYEKQVRYELQVAAAVTEAAEQAEAERAARVRRLRATAASRPAAYSVGPYAIPTYIVMCESGGNYRAENPTSTASGAYQILDGTWAGYGGYHHAADAPPAVQDAKAAALWDGGAGRFHWAACA